MNRYKIKYFDGMKLLVVAVHAVDVTQAIYNSGVIITQILEVRLTEEEKL